MILFDLFWLKYAQVLHILKVRYIPKLNSVVLSQTSFPPAHHVG